MTTDNRTETRVTENKRANKVSVQLTGDGLIAKFYKTHRHITTVVASQTAWQPNEAENKSAQRESFRKWVCDNAGIFGVEWNPADLRDEKYKLPNRYDTDELLTSAVVRLVGTDIEEWVANLRDRYTLQSIEVDEIIPVNKSAKGNEVNPKYNNGAWAWATIRVIVTVGRCTEDRELEIGYVTMEASLVSGQLKKPSKIGSEPYTKTGFKTELAKDLPEEVKAEPKVEETPEVNTEEFSEVPNSEPKKERKPRKSKKVAEVPNSEPKKERKPRKSKKVAVAE